MSDEIQKTIDEKIKLMASEMEQVEKNMDIIQDFNQNIRNFSEEDIKILREYIKISSKGMKIKGRESNKWGFRNGNVREVLGMDEEKFYNRLRLLYLKGLLQDNGGKTTNQAHLENIFVDEPKQLKLFNQYGSVVNELMSDNMHLEITDNGIYYLNEDMIKHQERLLLEQAEILNSQIAHQRETTTILKETEEKITEKVNSISTKVEKFNESILTILSILVSAFAIIGVNINTIPKITENFIVNIISLNLSVAFSLTLLFYILNRLVFIKKDANLGKLLIALIIVLGLIVVSQAIGNQTFNFTFSFPNM